MLLYKYRSFAQFEYVLDLIVHERLYCAQYKDLNDPFEGTFFAVVQDGIRKSYERRTGQQLEADRETATVDDLYPVDDRKRICSLSRNCSDIRLWSLYADGHAGIAVEIDFSSHVRDIHQVQYNDALPLLHNSTPRTSPLVEDVFTQKSVHWSYEEEFRLIQSGEWYSVYGRIKRIILGPRVSKDRENLLKNLVRYIPIQRASLDYGSLQVIVRSSST